MSSPSVFGNVADETRGRKQAVGTQKAYKGKNGAITNFMYNAQHLPGGSHLGYLREHLDIRQQPFDHSTKVKVISPPASPVQSAVTTASSPPVNIQSNRKKRQRTSLRSSSPVAPTTKQRKEKPVYVYCRMKLPMPKVVWKEIFGWLISNTSLARPNRRSSHNNDDDVADDEQEFDVTVPSHFMEPEDQTDIAGIEGGFDPDAANKPTISVSTLQLYKSAVVWFHGKLGVAFKSAEEIAAAGTATEEPLDSYLNCLITGYKKIVAEKKSKGIMSVTEGKSVISDLGYIALMKALRDLGSEKQNGITKEDFQTAVFSTSWLSLQWNLLSRGASVEDIHLEHLQWSGDSLKVTFAKSKSDQTGEGKSNVKNVYANPLRPEICCILAMAIYFFSIDRDQQLTEDHRFKDSKFFQGKNQKARWADVLNRTVNSLSDDIDLGCHKSEVGTHSIRKGAATYLLALVDGPSAVQVYLRAGWTLGNVPDRYIFAGPGGDQLVGRYITLMPVHDAAFATLGPHFTQEGLQKISAFGWNRLVPGYDNFPDCFKSVVRVLLANIVYHHDNYLIKTLPQNHPLFRSPMFANHRSFLLSLMPYAVTGLNENLSTNVKATGVPGHLTSAAKLEKVEQAIAKLSEEQRKATEEMEKTMKESFSQLPGNLRDMLKKDFEGIGPKVLTEDALEKAFEKFGKTMQDRLSSEISNIRASLKEIESSMAATASQDSFGNKQIGTTAAAQLLTMQHLWGGKFRYCCRDDCTHPQHKDNLSNKTHNFEFPVCSTKQLFRLWQCGNSTFQVGPYKDFVEKDHYETLKLLPTMEGRNKIKNVGKAAKVMKELENILISQLQIENNNGEVVDKLKINADNCDAMFDKAYPFLYDRLYTDAKRGSNRKLDVAYTSLYNKLGVINVAGADDDEVVVGTALVAATHASSPSNIVITTVQPVIIRDHDNVMDLEF